MRIHSVMLFFRCHETHLLLKALLHLVTALWQRTVDLLLFLFTQFFGSLPPRRSLRSERRRSVRRRCICKQHTHCLRLSNASHAGLPRVHKWSTCRVLFGLLPKLHQLVGKFVLLLWATLTYTALTTGNSFAVAAVTHFDLVVVLLNTPQRRGRVHTNRQRRVRSRLRRFLRARWRWRWRQLNRLGKQSWFAWLKCKAATMVSSQFEPSRSPRLSRSCMRRAIPVFCERAVRLHRLRLKRRCVRRCTCVVTTSKHRRFSFLFALSVIVPCCLLLLWWWSGGGLGFAFNSTLGYPGEGPEQQVCLCSADLRIMFIRMYLQEIDERVSIFHRSASLAPRKARRPNANVNTTHSH